MFFVDIHALELAPEERGGREIKVSHPRMSVFTRLFLKNKFYAGFSSQRDLAKYAEKSLDVELQRKIKLVQRHQSKVNSFIH